MKWAKGRNGVPILVVVYKRAAGSHRKKGHHWPDFYRLISLTQLSNPQLEEKQQQQH